MSKRKSILFDVDGVLADFVTGFTTLANELYNVPISGMDNHKDFGFDYLNISREQIESLWDVVKNSFTFWLSLPHLLTPEEILGLRYFVYNHNVTFVTHRFSSVINPASQTAIWLKQQFDLKFPQVIATPSKGLAAVVINADFAIEDKASNALDIAKNSIRTQSYLLHKPYNTNWHDNTYIRHVNSVGEFFKEVNSD